MKITTVVVSRTPPRVPKWGNGLGRVHWRVNPAQAEPEHNDKRVQFIADERNSAVEEALRKYPDTTDIFMLDSYYTGQIDSCARLMSDYEHSLQKCILSGAIWGETRGLVKRKRFWLDTWAFPKCKDLSYPQTGLLQVESVGSAYIFPLTAYQRTPYQSFDGHTEHYRLCVDSGLPCFVDFSVDFVRRGKTSLYRRARFDYQCLRGKFGNA